MKPTRTWRLTTSLLWFSALAGLFACTEDIDLAVILSPEAFIESSNGYVRVQPQASAVDVTPHGKFPLNWGDVVSTGAEGTALVHFPNGASMTIDGHSSLKIGTEGGNKKASGAVLLGGSIKTRFAGKDVSFTVGTPFGLVQLGLETSISTISVNGGVDVEVGTLVVRQDAKSLTVSAGQKTSVEGIAVALRGAPPPAAADANTANRPPPVPLTFEVLAKPKAASVQLAGQGKWRPVQSSLQLRPGDKLSVNKTGIGTQVRAGTGTTLVLDSGTKIDFASAQVPTATPTPAYNLVNGALEVRVNDANGKPSPQRFSVAGAQVAVDAPVHSARVRVVSHGKAADVIVRSGEAVLDDGSRLEAGTLATVMNGKLVGKPRKIPGFRIDVHEHSNVTVYYVKNAPGINLVWSDKPTEQPVLVEVASDHEFTHVMIAESIRGGSLVVDAPLGETFFWRTHGISTGHGIVQLAIEASTDCGHCKVRNSIDDTGEKTTVYFQQTLPSLLLRWKPVSKAQSYELKVYDDDTLDKPLISLKLTETEKFFESGKFSEGEYYWLVTALNDKEEQLASGSMNDLQVAYDNALLGVVIRTPRTGQHISGNTLNVTGETPLGWPLFINGKAAEVDANGRFDQAIPIHIGTNYVILESKHRDGTESVHYREFKVDS